MAFDSKTFFTRTTTAIVFVAVMLTGLLWNKISFAILFTIIFMGCWLELIKLLKKIIPNRPLLMMFFGLIYIALPIVLMLFIRFDPDLPNDTLRKVVPCGIIFSIWINDTMAYICGSLFGKTPLTPISPKKTVEGTFMGMTLAVIAITIAGWLSGFLRVADWISISLISAVAGTFGDLLESKLKRMAGVKDSGKIMPGHGGFLDRFDSMLVAIPFVFVYWILFIK
jgi:phosphatidate cytidylyltransferase